MQEAIEGKEVRTTELTRSTAANGEGSFRCRLSMFASVKITIAALVLLAATILLGAWCPQESQVGFSKVIEQFGEQNAYTLQRLGVTDIFHSPWLLFLIGILTVNMVACSMQRVFPKINSLKQAMPFLTLDAIARLPSSQAVSLPMKESDAIVWLEERLKQKSYSVRRNGMSLCAEFGKVGRLAPTVTHIGLLTLLAGVTISSWTGFSGFQPVALGGEFNFENSDHSRLWIGSLPTWKVRVEATRREDYQSGDPKQWYSNLAVIDESGKVVKRQEIKVNEPLSYNGVDIYQSSWALDSLVVSFNGHKRELELKQMGKIFASFLPLAPETVLIFSVHDQKSPLRVFAKTGEWSSPRLIAELGLGKSIKLGGVTLNYERLIPITGLQYKCDPALPIVYIAFALIMLGVVMAAIPYRQVWAFAESKASDKESTPLTKNEMGVNAQCVLHVGGRAQKAKVTFERQLLSLLETMKCTKQEAPNV